VTSEEAGGPGDGARAPRDNDAWVRALADDGTDGEAAQRDLRALLVRGLRRMLAQRSVADDLCEDLAHEALLRIRARLSTFRGASRFTTWALSIATRVAFDELRHHRWKDISLEALMAADTRAPTFEAPGEAPPDKRLARERLLATLQAVIDHALTDKQRAVLVAELDGIPHGEIARALGMSRNGVYKLGHDARKRVKLHLETAGLSETDVSWAFE
jgi:RNA polymerase sigma-70 factor (ECF subfamily)